MLLWCSWGKASSLVPGRTSCPFASNPWRTCNEHHIKLSKCIEDWTYLSRHFLRASLVIFFSAASARISSRRLLTKDQNSEADHILVGVFSVPWTWDIRPEEFVSAFVISSAPGSSTSCDSDSVLLLLFFFAFLPVATATAHSSTMLVKVTKAWHCVRLD